MSLRFRYQPPNLAISTLYWKAWPLLLVVAAFNPENIGEPPLPGGLAVVPAGCCSLFLSGRRAGWGPAAEPGRDPGGAAGLWAGRHPFSSCSLGLAAWEEYPTLKMLMEMVMTK